MNNLVQFSFQENNVRTIADNRQATYLVLQDVLDAIGSNTRRGDAVAAIEKGFPIEGKGGANGSPLLVRDAPLETSGGVQNTTIIHEAAAAG